MAEPAGDDLARAAQQTAADEDRVEETLVHPEAVERDHGDPVGQRLDRRRQLTVTRPAADSSAVAIGACENTRFAGRPAVKRRVYGSRSRWVSASPAGTAP